MHVLTHRARWLFAIAAVVVFSPAAFAHDVPDPIALINGRILTGENGKVIENGTVLIKDEKIAAVGADVKIPDGTKTIDCAGMTISPGLIDVRSKLWIERGSASASSTTGNLNLADAIDAFSEDWADVARQGVTAVCVQPSGSMGGRCVVLRVAGGHDAAHLTIEGASGIQASLGTGARNGPSRYSQYTSLKKRIEAVKKYQDEWKKYHEAVKKWEEEQKKKKDGKGKKGDKAKKPEKKEEKKPAATKKVKVLNFRGRKIPLDRVPPQVLEQMKARGATIEEIDAPAGSGGTTVAKAGSSSKSKDGKPKEPKKDKVKEVLVKLLERKIPLRVEVNTADDAMNAIKLGEELKIDIVLEGLAKLGRGWKKVNEARSPLVAGPMIGWESAPARRSDWFSDVAASGNVVAISTFARSPRGSRLLRAHAAAAVAEGLSSDRALAAVTINAAKVLGLSSKLGSIKVGKHGDIAVFAGHPTDPAAPVMLTVSQGQITYQVKDKLTAVDSNRVEVSGLPPVLPNEYSLKSSRVQKADGTFGPATIKVAGGKIISVGDDSPDDVFDLGDAVITPGLVVGHAPGSSSASIDPVAAHTHAADNYNPESDGLSKMRKAGFTAIAYAPVSSNVVAGQMACVRFGADQPVAMKDKWPHTIAGKFVLSGASRSTSRFPSALTGQVDFADSIFRRGRLRHATVRPGFDRSSDGQASGRFACFTQERRHHCRIRSKLRSRSPSGFGPG